MSPIKKYLNSEDKKRLFSNFISLSILQGANYILPLITLPYLVRVLSPFKFGLIAFAQAFIAYFNILTDYGFNLSATREVSLYRNNKEKLSEIFSSVIVIKFGLLIISFVILNILVLSFERFKRDYLVYYFSFGAVLGQALFPVWFFQGMERMKYITILNITAKLMFTISIFVFVKKISDYIYVPLLNSLSICMVGMLSLWIIFNKKFVNLCIPSFLSIQHRLKSSWHIFISTAGISMYKRNSIFILGLFSKNDIVGFFSISKKLIDVVNSLASVISQTIYPFTMRNIKNRYINNFLLNVGFIIFITTFLFAAILISFSRKITFLLTGSFYPAVSTSIKLLAFVPLIIGINVPAVHKLLGEKKDKLFSIIVLSGGLIDLILNFTLVPFFSYIGSCISVILTESYITLSLYWFAFVKR